MSPASEPPSLIFGLRCRSCANTSRPAFSRERTVSVEVEDSVLMGGRWVPTGKRSDREPEDASGRVVCLACGAEDPDEDRFHLPPAATDAQSNRHLIVEALAEASRLAAVARDHARAKKSGPTANALRELSERLTRVLAEGDDRATPQPALRAARAEIEDRRQAVMILCGKLRWRPQCVRAAEVEAATNPNGG